jgi:uncharacterized protein YjiK
MLKLNFTILLKAKLLILFLYCLTACSQETLKNILFERPGYSFEYQLNEPVQSWKLPSELVEISGLGFTDHSRLACVQDEKGIIYIFNLNTGKVESEISFGDDGDYEGVEIIENDAWILKSNGTLYKVSDYLKKAAPGVKKYSTALSGKNDTEGLAYDPVNKKLLIACKEDPFVDEKEAGGLKAIYSYDPETNLIDLKPFLLISPDTIKHYKGGAIFMPSGIAIHPVTGDIFILGSVGKLLLVFSRMGELLAIIKLSPEIFRQPEGICFSPDGRLYIASEGDGRAGSILKFEPKDK